MASEKGTRHAHLPVNSSPRWLPAAVSGAQVTHDKKNGWPHPGLSGWRTLLRSCRAAGDAAYLGPTGAAQAAVEVLRQADPSLRIKVKCVLASQAAKNEFLTD